MVEVLGDGSTGHIDPHHYTHLYTSFFRWDHERAGIEIAGLSDFLEDSQRR